MGEAARVYAEQLYSLGLGHPQWFPEPDHGEVHIGDVGFFRSDGKFRRLFNITVDADHEWNKLGVPEHFGPITIPGHLIDHSSNYLSAGMHSSRSVTTTEIAPHISASVSLAVQVGLTYKFECSKQHGAFLLLKDKASKELVNRTPRLERYIIENHNTWHRFITQQLEYRCEIEDVICISGCIKADEWTVAALFSSGKTQECKIQGHCGTLASIGLDVQIEEKLEMSCSKRHGPEQQLSEGRVMQKDQCVFIDFYKVKYCRMRGPKVIKAHAEPNSDSDIEDSDDTAGDAVTARDANEGLKMKLGLIPRTTRSSWPLDVLLRNMLKHTCAQVVLARHTELYQLFSREWTSDIGAEILTSPHLVDIDRNGVGTLSYQRLKNLYNDIPATDDLAIRPTANGTLYSSNSEAPVIGRNDASLDLSLPPV